MTHAIRIHRPGGPDVLTWEKVAVGDPGVGQVRLRHRAIGLNYIDVYHRTGLYPVPMPFIPGQAGAGIVEAVGEGVTDITPGDRVAYSGISGAYAEERLVAAERVIKLPDTIGDDVASAMLLQGLTVRFLVKQTYPVQSGDTILVHAAAGGVGLILCQWAAARGAAVIGTVSTKEKAVLAHANGCHYPIVTSDEDFLERVHEITKGKKLPVVYDSVGKETFSRSLDCLRPRGLMVLFGQSSGPVPPIDLNILAQKGSLFVTRPTGAHYTLTRQELLAAANDFFDMVSRGKIVSRINQRFELRKVAEAHRAIEARKTTGSTILIP